MSYEFLGEVEAFDYLDAMWNDGSQNETLIEDHLTEGWTPADEVSAALQRTWGEIELLPHTTYDIPGDEHCTL